MTAGAARRVIVKNTSKRDAELTSESESDGWYLDAPAAWLNLHPPLKGGAVFHLGFLGGGKRDDFKPTQNGELETGFPLLVARTETVRKVIEALDQMDPARARFIAGFGYILSRVANADLTISPEETRAMERIGLCRSLP